MNSKWKMQQANQDVNLRSCAFVLELTYPMQTMTRVTELLMRKGIKVSSMHYQLLEGKEAKLVIHCELAKDKIAYIGRHFEEMHGVKEVDWMNARIRIKQF